MSWVNVGVAAVSAVGQPAHGAAANRQGRYEQAVADYQAKQEQQGALKMADVIRKAGRRQVGAANAQLAASGVKVGEGSAGDIERQIFEDSEADAFQTILTGDRRASDLRLQGLASRIAGQNAKRASVLSAVNTMGSAWARGSMAGNTGRVTQADLNSANRSSDPIGELNKIKGWT